MRDFVIIDRKNGFALAADKLPAWLVFTLLASLALMLWLFARSLPEVDKWQLWARHTARFSFFLFLATYLAAPLYEIRQTAITDWLRRNRRNAGISFGVAHIIHLGALVGFFVVSGLPADPVTVIVGGGAYAAMFAMLATSNNRAIRALGQETWRRLHKFGVHYLALVFAFTYTSSLLGPAPKPGILIVLIWAAILLRLYILLFSRKGSAA